MNDDKWSGGALHLSASGLASKWGFNDGDCPDWLLDVCDDRGLAYPDDWHNTLRGLVRDFLLPAFPEGRRPSTYNVETIHNPIRTDDFTDSDAPDVTVSVPVDVVLARCVVEPPGTRMADTLADTAPATG